MFKPNCTLPPPNTNFVASPSTRGTLSILWNCLSIIILCTWNIQHLNIPARRPYYNSTGVKHGWFVSAWWGFLDMRTTLWWMILTIVAPEYIMGRAISERFAAASSLMTLKSRFGDEMEMVHAYVMNMGGYFLDFSEVGFFGALTALQLLRAKDFQLFKLLPPVSSQHLESMTNTDFLAKLIAVTQVIWLMIQLLVRHQNGILSSQMEIATLAFAACSIVTYVIHWDRPRGITTRYEIKATKAPKEDQILALATF
ncbi:hypothetical protein DL95DRAFT_362168 [Leptodontidium sp. 2 PMI_412]|nr:hypothetical protein DL95DRAFT_362168 [Leptodontidium sp. 2 PMI_412]